MGNGLYRLIVEWRLSQCSYCVNVTLPSFSVLRSKQKQKIDLNAVSHTKALSNDAAKHKLAIKQVKRPASQFRNRRPRSPAVPVCFPLRSSEMLKIRVNTNKKAFQSKCQPPAADSMGYHNDQVWTCLWGCPCYIEVQFWNKFWTCLEGDQDWALYRGGWEHVDRQTDMTENITFPQLRWRALKTWLDFTASVLSSPLIFMTSLFLLIFHWHLSTVTPFKPPLFHFSVKYVSCLFDHLLLCHMKGRWMPLTYE